ncbi:MAG TPA: hypothetical protein VGL03_04850 [Thermoanaerobaculia bacterium]
MAFPILHALAGVLALTAGDPEIARATTKPPEGMATASGPCSAPENRQFDFWLGEWDVTTPDGKLAGANRITRILSGCALREEWSGAGGIRGTSLNVFDAGARRWRQTWVDEKGNVLFLTGELKGGKMLLEGEGPSRDGTLQNRISWSKLSNGRVRQLWESSKDGGKTWKTVFDGTYTPRNR